MTLDTSLLLAGAPAWLALCAGIGPLALMLRRLRRKDLSGRGTLRCALSRGWTPHTLAASCHVSVKTMKGWLDGSRTPKNVTWAHLGRTEPPWVKGPPPPLSRKKACS